jgi:hypothetical protein
MQIHFKAIQFNLIDGKQAERAKWSSSAKGKVEHLALDSPHFVL